MERKENIILYNVKPYLRDHLFVYVRINVGVEIAG